MTRAELIDKVAANTQGTKGDPLTREEVEVIVNATLELIEQYIGVEVLDD